MDLDTNINSYTIEELFEILGNPETIQEIKAKSGYYMNLYTTQGNDKLFTFFKQIQKKLIDYTNLINIGTDDDNNNEFNKQNSIWWKEGTALTQVDNSIEKNKTTDRVNKIDIYNNQHLPMNRQQLGVNNTFSLPVMQDGKLNPNLENVTNRFILLDSSYRQTANSGENSNASDYTCDISDPLKNVLSLRLYSIQLPFAWYNIDQLNSCFWLQNMNNFFTITIPSGNYNINNFILTLISTFESLGFQPTLTSANIYYTQTTGKLTINIYGITDPYGNVINESSQLIFFDFTETLMCARLQTSKHSHTQNEQF